MVDDRIVKLLEKQIAQTTPLSRELREIRLTLAEIHSTLFELLEKKSPKDNQRPIHKVK